MKVLVTGGAGYIGSHTTNKLIEAGHSVVVVDDLSTGFQEAIPTAAKFVQGDVTDTDFLSSVMQAESIQAVVHFAAKLVVPESVAEPVLYYRTNVGGMLSLLEAARRNGLKKIVFSSTAAVYGDSAVDGVVTEESPTAPLNPYGASKLMSETILKDADLAYGIRSVTLRYFNVAGAALDGSNGQRTAKATHLIKVACEVATGGRHEVGIFGVDYPTKDGTGVRDYIHVEDLADLHVLALAYLENNGRTDIFNCGYGTGFSVREVIEKVREVSGVAIKATEQGRRPGDSAALVANSEKVQKAFGWKPLRNDLATICRSAFEWEKKSTR